MATIFCCSANDGTGISNDFKETLENQANLRENRALIADQDWIDGWQAAWIR